MLGASEYRGDMDNLSTTQDLISRATYALQHLPTLTHAQLNAHPAGHPNSIAWLLWHTGREVDIQLSQLTGEGEAWPSYRGRFQLGELGDTLGFGHSDADAREIILDDQEAVRDYILAALEAMGEYVASLDEDQWDEVIDTSWDPPVTRQVRLVSVLIDAIQHLAQAAYIAGAPDL